MPIHDWTRVPAGIFHHFHHAWIEEISRFLNRGHLPEGYYALAEQLAGRLGPDVLALHAGAAGNGNGKGAPVQGHSPGGVRVAERKPKARFHIQTLTETETYAARAKAVVIRHASDHSVIAMVEIVSPGNKSSQNRIGSFVRKEEETLAAGIHLLIADLFPPTPRDPEGLHRAIWPDREDGFEFNPAKPLTCVSYVSDPLPEAFIEPVGLGDDLPEMPLFLTPEEYVPLPLEITYQAAWNEVPAYWREFVAKPA
ncbi:MAG: DUF4058 family protein [Planctomycetes bacterium]|nr:DUF4058 family protein [Planctomycetota bacterium]